MSFQLSLPASQPSPEAPHTLESLTLGAPGTLTVEVLSREQRAATGQRAHARLGTRPPVPAAARAAVPAGAGAVVTFTA